jgi:hypothetical protein
VVIESRLLDTKIARRLLDNLMQCRAEPRPFGVRHLRVRRLATPHQDDPVEKLRCPQNGIKVWLGIEGGDVGIEARFDKRLVPLARVARAKHAENGVLGGATPVRVFSSDTPGSSTSDRPGPSA